MGIICTGGVIVEDNTNELFEELSSGRISPLVDESATNIDLDFQNRTKVLKKINLMLVIFNEKTLNPYKIRDVSRVLQKWNSEKRKLFYDLGGITKILQLIEYYSHFQTSQTEQKNKKQTSKRGPEVVKLISYGGTFGLKLLSDGKGIGFGTGSTQSQWNIKRAMEERRRHEILLISLLRVIVLYIGGNVDLDEDNVDIIIFEAVSLSRTHITQEFTRVIGTSCLPKIMEIHFRNESIFDISQHLELYKALLLLTAVLSLFAPTAKLLNAKSDAEKTKAKNLYQLIQHFYHNLEDYSLSMPQSTTAKDDNFSKFCRKVMHWYAIIKCGVSIFALDSADSEPIVDREQSQAQPMAADDAQNSSSSYATAHSHKHIVYLSTMKPYLFSTFPLSSNLGRQSFPFSFDKESLSLQPFSVSLAGRMSRITKEVATLRNSLPLSFSSSIFVCMDENRSDILKVLITGPEETPYQNGIFIFDVFFPKNYPISPPKVCLTTTGNGAVRFNPNLYNDGKVCLSILNTWEGRPEERWNPSFSLLQVLVSLQALIFVTEPYFNEPGFERMRGSIQAQKESEEYNTRIRHATLQFAVLYYIKNMPLYFEQIIRRHFYLKKDDLIWQCHQWQSELNRLDKSKTAHNYEGGLPVAGMEETVKELQKCLLEFQVPCDI